MPGELWKFWDKHNFEDKELLGYWDKDCPVKTNNEHVIISIFKGKNESVIE